MNKDSLKMYKDGLKVVGVIGTLLFGYGLYEYREAEETANVQTTQAIRQLGPFGGIIVGMDAGARKDAGQEIAKKRMGWGGGIFFVGLLLFVSARPSDKLEEAQPEEEKAST